MRLANTCQRKTRGNASVDAPIAEQFEHREHIVHARAADAEQIELQPDHIGCGDWTVEF